MAFYLESEGFTKTIVNGKIVDDRGYEAVSNSKGTNVLIHDKNVKYLYQEAPSVLSMPAERDSLIVRLNNDFMKGRNRKTRRNKKKRKRKKKRKTARKNKSNCK